MNNGKSLNKAIFLIISSVVLLIFIWFVLPDNMKIFGLKLRKYDFKDLSVESKNNNENIGGKNYKFDFYRDFSTDNKSSLIKFFNSLINNEHVTNKVRIAYFGDSEIEGDLICDDLRKTFQTTFGGRGIGYLGINPPDAQARRSIRHNFSNWSESKLFSSKETSYNRCLNGVTYFANIFSNVSYEILDTSYYFNTLKLFYGNAKKGSNVNIISSGNYYNENLEVNINLINQLLFDFKKPVNNVRLDFSEYACEVYGVSLESNTGIYLDNFPYRSHSGMGFRDISPDALKTYDSLLNYKLIFLHFGVNALSKERNDFSFYATGQIEAINHLKKYFPDASFIFIGTGDKSSNVDGIMKTDPKIPELINTQISIAELTKIGFINLYKVMGGENSMLDWVKRGLASKDHVHFTREGGKVIASFIYETIMANYYQYLATLKNN